jgi:hypothetical protein
MNDCHCHKDDTWHPEGHANATCEPSGTANRQRPAARSEKKMFRLWAAKFHTIITEN